MEDALVERRRRGCLRCLRRWRTAVDQGDARPDELELWCEPDHTGLAPGFCTMCTLAIHKPYRCGGGALVIARTSGGAHAVVALLCGRY